MPSLLSLGQRLVGWIASKGVFMDMVGMDFSSSNFTEFDNPIQSCISVLKSQKQIRSAHTNTQQDRNQYCLNKVLRGWEREYRSTPLGVYDASIIEFNYLTVCKGTCKIAETLSLFVDSLCGKDKEHETGFVEGSSR